MGLHIRNGQLVEHRPWTEADLAEARRLRRAAANASEIGRILKRTRNSVIGALHRAGEPGVRLNQNPKWVKPVDPSPPRRWSWEADDARP